MSTEGKAPPSPPPSSNTKRDTLQYLYKEIANLVSANNSSYGCITTIFRREKRNYKWLSLPTLKKAYYKH